MIYNVQRVRQCISILPSPLSLGLFGKHPDGRALQVVVRYRIGVVF